LIISLNLSNNVFIVSARTGTLVLTGRQTGLLVSPARLEILEALEVLDRASARELAAHLGRPPGAVYHHVRTLTQGGLIVEVAVRRGARRPEVLYALAARRQAVAAGASPSGDRQALRTLQAVLRQAGRDVEAAFARGPASLKRRFYGGQMSSALTARDVKRVMALLEEIESLLRRARRTRSGRTDDIYRWTSVFVPLARRRS
jgi:DNA-binding transcriptional ArsR family regulator